MDGSTTKALLAFLSFSVLTSNRLFPFTPLFPPFHLSHSLISFAMANGHVYAVSAFAALGGLSFGLDTGMISGVLTMENFVDYMTNGEQQFTSLQSSTIVSTLLAGCFVGALMSGLLCERLGRKRTILIGSLILILGVIIQTAANGYIMICVGRPFAGVGIGMLSMTVPLYQSELAPKAIRGRLISLQQFAITIGIMLSFWINYGTNLHLQGTATWRVPLALQMAPAIVLAVGTMFLPYSPRWLLQQGRNEEAQQVLARLHGNGDKNHPYVLEEYNEICEQIALEKAVAIHSYVELLQGTVRRRVILGVLIQIFQQLTGINAIMYYAPSIFQATGINSGNASLLATGINGVVNVLATIPAILWVDRWGRRWTLVSGAIVMGICMIAAGIVLGVCGKIVDKVGGDKSIDMSGNQAASYFSIVMIYLFVAGFAYSWGPCGWIYPAEIFPLRIRSKATSVTTAANWLFNFVVGEIVPIMLARITFGTFIFFGGCCFIMAIIVFFFFPETKGKSLEEMEFIFGERSKDFTYLREKPDPYAGYQHTFNSSMYNSGYESNYRL
jgi:sugar porter (SP) family MFS transporter